MNEPGNENVRIGGIADELEENPEVCCSPLETDLKSCGPSRKTNPSVPGMPSHVQIARREAFPTRCLSHFDRADWVDGIVGDCGRPSSLWIRTTCRRCRGFIGYRKVVLKPKKDQEDKKGPKKPRQGELLMSSDTPDSPGDSTTEDRSHQERQQ